MTVFSQFLMNSKTTTRATYNIKVLKCEFTWYNILAMTDFNYLSGGLCEFFEFKGIFLQFKSLGRRCRCGSLLVWTLLFVRDSVFRCGLHSPYSRYISCSSIQGDRNRHRYDFWVLCNTAYNAKECHMKTESTQSPN